MNIRCLFVVMSMCESDTTEWLHFHLSLSCIGGGDGNPLQCSCLENPRDRGAWLAAIYGVTQSWTRLKWLSSSSSRTFNSLFDCVKFVRNYQMAHRVYFLPLPRNPFWGISKVPKIYLSSCCFQWIFQSIHWFITNHPLKDMMDLEQTTNSGYVEIRIAPMMFSWGKGMGKRGKCENNYVRND